MAVARVGNLRVTNPFASIALRRPIDLHALSTPPAFILDQDQILKNTLNYAEKIFPLNLR